MVQYIRNFPIQKKIEMNYSSMKYLLFSKFKKKNIIFIINVSISRFGVYIIINHLLKFFYSDDMFVELKIAVAETFFTILIIYHLCFFFIKYIQ